MNHQESKRKYQSLLNQLTEKLWIAFPLGSDVPVDEYTAEAQLILARLKEADSPEHLASIVREVFRSQFDGTFAVSSPGYDEVAAWLWDVSRGRVS